ncbi:hypothetical protein PB1_12004 [Bacillus methanolicus PB1]|uniref:Uncharacterized protein n=1 Tax=Bacillus methanolicus PB1 TaxID=997296 RepID=I3DVL2_BACMT|nr:hypothetical protein [Bacillus methanolicus]EIJ78283.1 hypothetical protein PB1_12004 [Bacillus methanolicus PB1]
MAKEILGEILKDLQSMKTDFDELKQGQNKLEQGQIELKSDFAELKEGQHRLEKGYIELKSDVAQLKDGQLRLEQGQNEIKDTLKHFATLTIENFTNIRKELRMAVNEIKSDVEDIKQQTN